MFIGREREMGTLERLYQSGAFEFVVIYGRRRVGKTTLISEFIKDKKAVFYPGIDSNEKQNLEILSASIMSVFTGAEIETVFRDFSEALELIYRMSEEERVIFVIDEYPYLANCKPQWLEHEESFQS